MKWLEREQYSLLRETKTQINIECKFKARVNFDMGFFEFLLICFGKFIFQFFIRSSRLELRSLRFELRSSRLAFASRNNLLSRSKVRSYRSASLQARQRSLTIRSAYASYKELAADSKYSLFSASILISSHVLALNRRAQ